MTSVLSISRRLLASETGRREPMAVLGRFVRWQLQRRALGRPLRFQLLTGANAQLLPGASDTLSGLWYEKLPDFPEMLFALHLMRTGDLFVDVGANQGAWTLLLAGQGARVIAFEPVSVTRDRLLANLALNSQALQDRVAVHAVGLGEKAQDVVFTAHLDAGNHRVRGDVGAETTIRVRLESADDVLAQTSPRLIKIDVEGEELGVLRGAASLLSRPSLRAVIMETFRPSNYATPTLMACERILSSAGFAPMAYDPARRALRPLRHPWEGSQNTLYVREPATLCEYLANTCCPYFR